ncbi:MAG: hypothetical protein FJ098_08745, partial [Deltaproteobacteria bacterium]|nr:hypothetical protein [Deltaproteobacteria bacterium]
MRFPCPVLFLAVSLSFSCLASCGPGSGGQGEDTAADTPAADLDTRAGPDLVDTLADDERGEDSPRPQDRFAELPPDLADEALPDTPQDLEPPPTQVGEPCLEDSDCLTDGGCLLGFCTAICRQDGVMVPGACDHPSEASTWGSEFGCPVDLDRCVPGPVLGLSVRCTEDGLCNAQGLLDAVCAGVLQDAEGGLHGLCLPSLGRKEAGKSCSVADGGGVCASFFCLPTAGGPADGPGLCSAWCAAQEDCPGGTACTLHGVPDPEFPSQTLGFVGLCVPVDGSVLPCSSDLDCVVGKEVCAYVFPPSSEAPVRVCLESPEPFGAGVGEPCLNAGDCFGPLCLFQQWATKVAPYCTSPCSLDDECPPGMACRSIPVNDLGAPASDGGWL